MPGYARYAAYKGTVPEGTIASPIHGSDIGFMNVVITFNVLAPDIRVDDLAVRLSTEDKDGDGLPNWKEPDDRDPMVP